MAVLVQFLFRVPIAVGEKDARVSPRLPQLQVMTTFKRPDSLFFVLKYFFETIDLAFAKCKFYDSF